MDHAANGVLGIACKKRPWLYLQICLQVKRVSVTLSFLVFSSLVQFLVDPILKKLASLSTKSDIPSRQFMVWGSRGSGAPKELHRVSCTMYMNIEHEHPIKDDLFYQSNP